MTPAEPTLDVVAYVRPDGELVTAQVESREPGEAPRTPLLRGENLVLKTGSDVVDVRRLTMAARTPADRREAGERIDAEVLAGLRTARWSAVAEPPACFSRVLGYEPPGELPFVLLEPYRGRRVVTLAGQLLEDEQRRFLAGFLQAVRWIGASGLVHRALSPDSVRWDGTSLQVTDFVYATLIGAPRTIVGSPPWAAREQHDPAYATGRVSDRDDVWAAGRLLFEVLTGDPLSKAGLLRRPDLAALLAGVFGPVEGRPPVIELLRRAGVPDPLPPAAPPRDVRFQQGRREFFEIRARKYPPPPPPPAPEPTPPGRTGRWGFRRRTEEAS